jgi:hypothetical protein
MFFPIEFLQTVACIKGLNQKTGIFANHLHRLFKRFARNNCSFQGKLIQLLFVGFVRGRISMVPELPGIHADARVATALKRLWS